MINDLFYNGSFTDKIKKIKVDIKNHMSNCGVVIPKTLSLCRGNVDNVNNNMLIVGPPFQGSKYFESKNDKMLFTLLQDLGIDKVFYTYCHLFKLPHYSRETLQTFSIWIKTLTELIGPKLILILGEQAELSYLKRKVILKENHGTVIGDYNGIPLMLTYPVEYYSETGSKWETSSYKEKIMQKDWLSIKNKYNELIK